MGSAAAGPALVAALVVLAVVLAVALVRTVFFSRPEAPTAAAAPRRARRKRVLVDPSSTVRPTGADALDRSELPRRELRRLRREARHQHEALATTGPDVAAVAVDVTTTGAGSGAEASTVDVTAVGPEAGAPAGEGAVAPLSAGEVRTTTDDDVWAPREEDPADLGAFTPAVGMVAAPVDVLAAAPLAPVVAEDRTAGTADAWHQAVALLDGTAPAGPAVTVPPATVPPAGEDAPVAPVVAAAPVVSRVRPEVALFADGPSLPGLLPRLDRLREQLERTTRTVPAARTAESALALFDGDLDLDRLLDGRPAAAPGDDVPEAPEDRTGEDAPADLAAGGTPTGQDDGADYGAAGPPVHGAVDAPQADGRSGDEHGNEFGNDRATDDEAAAAWAAAVAALNGPTGAPAPGDGVPATPGVGEGDLGSPDAPAEDGATPAAGRKDRRALRRQQKAEQKAARQDAGQQAEQQAGRRGPRWPRRRGAQGREDLLADGLLADETTTTDGAPDVAVPAPVELADPQAVAPVDGAADYQPLDRLEVVEADSPAPAAPDAPPAGEALADPQVLDLPVLPDDGPAAASADPVVDHTPDRLAEPELLDLAPAPEPALRELEPLPAPTSEALPEDSVPAPTRVVAGSDREARRQSRARARAARAGERQRSRVARDKAPAEAKLTPSERRQRRSEERAHRSEVRRLERDARRQQREESAYRERARKLGFEVDEAPAATPVLPVRAEPAAVVVPASEQVDHQALGLPEELPEPDDVQV